MKTPLNRAKPNLAQAVQDLTPPEALAIPWSHNIILVQKIKDPAREDLHPDLRADYVFANGSMSSDRFGEGDIHRALIEADLVDCMVALPVLWN